MMKNYYIGKIKKSGKCKNTKQDVSYIQLRYLRPKDNNINDKEQFTRTLTDKDGRRLQWFKKPIDPYQKQRNKEATSLMDLIIRELELKRDKGVITWEMAKNGIVPVDTEINSDSWGSFVMNHCEVNQTGHKTNYLQFLNRFKKTFTDLPVKTICSDAFTTKITDVIKFGLKGQKGILKSNGQPYSAVTLKHYWVFHIDCVNRAKNLQLIDTLPNMKLIQEKLNKAVNKKLKDKKGQYTDEELKTFQAYLEDLERKDPRFIKTKHKQLIEVLKAFMFSVIYTGLRESDLVDLDWSHITEFDNDNFKLEKTMNKTDDEVTIIFNKKACRYIGKQKKSGLVFNLNKKDVANKWNAIKDKCKIKNNGRKVVGIGMCRHTHAYRLINAIQNSKDLKGRFDLVQTRLGHKSIKTTFKHYVSKPDSYYLEGAKALEKAGVLDV